MSHSSVIGLYQDREISIDENINDVTMEILRLGRILLCSLRRAAEQICVLSRIVNCAEIRGVCCDRRVIHCR